MPAFYLSLLSSRIINLRKLESFFKICIAFDIFFTPGTQVVEKVNLL